MLSGHPLGVPGKQAPGEIRALFFDADINRKDYCLAGLREPDQLAPMNRRTLMRRATGLAFGFGVLPLIGACRRVASSDPAFVALRERYFLRMLQLNPVTSTYLGGDGYSASLAEVNGRLRDNSAAGMASELAFLRGIESELSAFDPATLGPDERIDHAVMGSQLAFLLRQIADNRYWQRCGDTYAEEPFRGVDLQIQQLTDVGGGLMGTADEWEMVASRLAAVPGYLEVARGNLLTGKAGGTWLDARLVREGIATALANETYFSRTVPGIAQPRLGTRRFAGPMRDRLRRVGAQAAVAYRQFAGLLGTIASPDRASDHFAIGEADYAWRLKNCLLERRSPARLYADAATVVEEAEAQVFRVAEEGAREAQLGLRFDSPAARRASTRTVFDFLQRDYPRDDAELFSMNRDIGRRIVAYGRELELFDIPADYQCVAQPTPPSLRGTVDWGYYPAPVFKRGGAGRFYIRAPGNDLNQLKQMSRAAGATLFTHMGFPGHDWQYRVMRAHAGEISGVRWLNSGGVEDSSSMWQNYLALEGWASYAVELIADPAPGRPHGFYTAGEHLFALQTRVRQGVRLRTDIGLHTGRMTFEEAVDYTTEHQGHAPDSRAVAETDPHVRNLRTLAGRELYRQTKWPTQALTFGLGRAAIDSLRRDFQSSTGGNRSTKAFHDRLLAMGPVPISLYRDAFLND